MKSGPTITGTGRGITPAKSSARTIGPTSRGNSGDTHAIPITINKGNGPNMGRASNSNITLKGARTKV